MKRILLVLILSLFLMTPARATELGTLSGRFLFSNLPPPQGAFLVGTCEVLYDSEHPDEPASCAYDMNNSPKAPLGSGGSFYISDIEYGNVGLVMQLDEGMAIMPHYPDGGQIIIEISGATDIGTLFYDDIWCSLDFVTCYTYLPLIRH
jgi:hypothetical protein